MPYRAFDVSQLQARPCPAGRLRAQSLAPLAGEPAPEWAQLAMQVSAAREAGRPVVCLLGGAGLVAGLGPAVAALLERGAVTHAALDGAAAGRDFELALAGETCADPSAPLGDEAGAGFHAALQAAMRDGLGAGEALGRALAGVTSAGREASLLARAYELGVPCTVHATPGADPLSLHPACDFAALGWASGRDYAVLCTTAAAGGGVWLNLAMGETGAGLLENALAAGRSREGTVMARLEPAPGWAEAARRLLATLAEVHAERAGAQPGEAAPQDPLAAVAARSAAAAQALQALLARQPQLAPAADGLARAYLAIARSLARGGTLFLCGNGGSMADALHISAEMLKSYTRPRPLPEALRARLAQEPGGEALAANLEQGLRAVVLGANLSLASAVRNDYAARGLDYAQELYALGRAGDVLLGISTSGRAANVGLAAGVARALGLTTIALTGAAGGPLAERADVAVRAPAERTDRVQEQHVLLYHTLCEMLEVDFFA